MYLQTIIRLLFIGFVARSAFVSKVLPIENKMRTPESFTGWNGILSVGMVTICSLYSAMGWYGYLKFGDEAKGSVTLNLPTDQL